MIFLFWVECKDFGYLGTQSQNGRRRVFCTSGSLIYPLYLLSSSLLSRRRLVFPLFQCPSSLLSKISVTKRFPLWASRPVQISCCTRPLPSAATVVMASRNNTTGGPSLAPQPVTPSTSDMKLLFVEMGTGYDQHGQNITMATMRACKNAISSNSIPAFRTGALPGVSYQQMKLKLKLGVPSSVQHELDIEQVKSVFPYGNIVDIEVVDGGLICSSGVALEAMGDKNDNCYVVNAAIYVGY